MVLNELNKRNDPGGESAGGFNPGVKSPDELEKRVSWCHGPGETREKFIEFFHIFFLKSKLSSHQWRNLHLPPLTESLFRHNWPLLRLHLWNIIQSILPSSSKRLPADFLVLALKGASHHPQTGPSHEWLNHDLRHEISLCINGLPDIHCHAIREKGSSRSLGKLIVIN